MLARIKFRSENPIELKIDINCSKNIGYAPLTVTFDAVTNIPVDTIEWYVITENSEILISKNNIAVYTFKVEGTYIVKVVAKTYFKTAEKYCIINVFKKKEIKIEEIMPNSNFYISSLISKVGEIIYFYPYIINNDWSYSWDFGDGSTSNDKATKHSYLNSGEYKVSLTVSDGVRSSTSIANIKIVDFIQRNIEIDFIPLKAKTQINSITNGKIYFDFENEIEFVNSKVFISDKNNDNYKPFGFITVDNFITKINKPISFYPILSTYYNVSYLWDFGDGEISIDKNPRHSYKNSGIYKVTLTATNSVGSNTFVTYIYVIGRAKEYYSYIYEYLLDTENNFLYVYDLHKKSFIKKINGGINFNKPTDLTLVY